MHAIFPEPMLRPCWEMGAIRPTMYWSLPFASLTTFPTTRISNDGYGKTVPADAAVSPSARPVCPAGCVKRFRLVVFTGDATEASPVIPEVLKMSDQVSAAAGICKMVLQGTVMVMP